MIIRALLLVASVLIGTNAMAKDVAIPARYQPKELVQIKHPD